MSKNAWRSACHKATMQAGCTHCAYAMASMQASRCSYDCNQLLTGGALLLSHPHLPACLLIAHCRLLLMLLLPFCICHASIPLMLALLMHATLRSVTVLQN